ncbi:MAG: SpoIID/LytB domain-containing protein [Microcoleus sp. CSU_2_2]|nr:SpoIID/LytB domain-containing protein [Microcoleus sp. SU_5_3]NJS12431.1 SpoIID/LytB domain-containing protein [Microcoleus sp. CSU_2_2]
MLAQAPQTPNYKWFSCISSTLLTAFCLLPLASATATAQSPQNRTLKVGVVQRFGTKVTDKLTLKALPGDRLTLRYKTPQGIETTNATSVKLEIAAKQMETVAVEERVVLSSHRSFESAEDSANQWRTQGIEVEIAQPLRWQVWAKRDVYNSPLVRRWLLQSLQAQGNKTAFLDTKVFKQMPQAFWVLKGFRFNRNELDITAGKNVIEVMEQTTQEATAVEPEKAIQQTRRYGGSLHLQKNAYGTYTLVNEVPTETYLRGVVPHEIGAFSPYASQEAQAILARTYALRNLRRFAVDNYELCADVNCQVYKGLTEVFPQTDKAIVQTSGLVLSYQNELVDALYSASSGGVTAPFGDVWHGPERPYLRSIVDSPKNVWDLSKQTLSDENNFRRFISLKNGFNEEKEETFRWREEVSLISIAGFLKQYLQKKQHPLANFKTLSQVQVVERSAGGRVLQMKVQTDLGTIDIDKDEIRNAFYPPISTLFYLEPIYNPDRTLNGYAFVGGGFGHGVGMSQTGSYNLANLGWNGDRILNFYFPGAQVVPLSDSITFWRQ